MNKLISVLIICISIFILSIKKRNAFIKLPLDEYILFIDGVRIKDNKIWLRKPNFQKKIEIDFTFVAPPIDDNLIEITVIHAEKRHKGADAAINVKKEILKTEKYGSQFMAKGSYTFIIQRRLPDANQRMPPVAYLRISLRTVSSPIKILYTKDYELLFEK